jgi:hypothetical protein
MPASALHPLVKTMHVARRLLPKPQRMLTTRISVLFLVLALGHASLAQAQAAPERRWSVDFGLGWDKGVSGNINSSAIGTLNDQTVVILKNKYEDVYGTGLNLRFGGGYLIREHSELRVTFTLQSLDADLTRMGDLGASNLYAEYDDYQSFGIDVGFRQYTPLQSGILGYGEATIGLAFIDETDVTLSAPAANFTADASDFYDRTAAFTFGVNVGVLFDFRSATSGLVSNHGVFTQVGLRYVSGMSQVDALVGTGLDSINDSSARWAMPFTAGMRLRF